MGKQIDFYKILTAYVIKLDFAFYFRRSLKPLQPKVKLHIGSDGVGAAKPLPVLAAYPFGDSDGNCLFAYGSLVKPGFEKMVIILINIFS